MLRKNTVNEQDFRYKDLTMEEKNDGGAAFPCSAQYMRAQKDDQGHVHFTPEGFYGMSMRQFYAAHALQGLLSNEGFMRDNAETYSDADPDMLRGTIAHTAFQFASAMIKAEKDGE